MRNFIPVAQLQQYVPNQPGSVEVVYQPFYDFQTYPTAGTTQMQFFQVPNGQGGKTFADTNMSLAGQLPSPTTLAVDEIQVFFLGSATDSLTAAALRAQTNWNDTIRVLNAGWLEVSVGSKTIFRDAPLNKFPLTFTIAGVSGIAMADTAAANQTDTQFARAVGKPYSVITIAIPQNQNFSVTLNWATAVAAQAGGRIGVILNGNWYRLSQ
jgi:hypothetical protein